MVDRLCLRLPRFRLPLAVTGALDELARRLEPADSDGLDPVVLPEGRFWRLRTLHAHNRERLTDTEAA